MKIKFLNNESYFAYDFRYINFNMVELSHPSIKKNESGFRVYSDAGIELYICEDFKTAYEHGEGYIRYINNPVEYKVYAIYNKDNYITDIISISDDREIGNGLLLRTGYQITDRYPEKETLIDSNGIWNYKNIDGLMTQLTEEEKKILLEIKKTEEENKKKEMERILFEKTLEDKLKLLSGTCGNAIFAGVTVNNKHYAYNLTDQNDIKNALEMASITGLDVPYHATNESCDLYTKEQLVEIFIAEETNLTHHVTYHNQLKLFTKQLTTIEEIAAVEYGQPLVGDYLLTYNKIMAQAAKVIQAFLGSAAK